MNNLIAQLLARAEVNLGDIGHRAVERITVPLKARLHEIVSETLHAVTGTLKVFAIKAGLAMAAGIMLLVALIFALCGLFQYIERLTGPLEALLIMAGIFLVLAIVFIVALVLWPSPRPMAETVGDVATRARLDAKRAMAETAAELRTSVRSAATTATTAEPIAPAPLDESPLDSDQAFESGLAAVVAALGEAGFHREQAGLRAGLTLSKQLRPMQVMSLALLGGFVAGLRMTAKRRR